MWSLYLDKKLYEVSQKILSKNDIKANELREIYKEKNLYVINLMSSPGSGKTTLLEQFAINKYFSFAVIEGDLETNRDSMRLQKRGIEAYQITTGDACHLEAAMIERAYSALESSRKLENIDFLFIENVGNLVCPASYDLGANINIVLLSTPEGDDKILKYPTMFMIADIVLITKSDIMEYFDFSIENIKSNINKINPKSKLFVVSNKDKDSLNKIADYLIYCKTNNIISKHQY
ncbi:hydrogenase accessory protein HypB [Helicobacter sp. MIT 99-5507]|nr:hydrogenase accessory protein HypB [Helicobacter sp. MIT 99-5507]